MDITDIDISEFLESEEQVEKNKQIVAECEAFMKSVGQLPIEIYRMEKFKPTKRPDETYGKFHVGDSYVVVKKQDKEYDIHLHVPEGAIPKDGPSAGIAIYTTLVSLMTKTPVSKHVAMTGEITLRGKVLPIGGLKEKMLAAKRGGIKTVLIPKDNVKDLKDIPDNIKGNLEVIPVATISEVLKHALVKKSTATAKKK